MPSDSNAQLESFLPQFGLSKFRPGQREVIGTVLSGRDCLCVMPTGGGKSLCYQLPAIVGEGLTLVVSPLIALMKDQVDQLQAHGLAVTFINSTLSMNEQYARLDAMAAGQYRLVYVVPERFRSQRFLEAVRGTRLRLLAVDEAHCISEWGHDFRPDYARLGHFRRMLGKPTTIALTATATDAVRRDIVEQLDLDDPRTFITGFARPNLFYEVQSVRSDGHKTEVLLDFLRGTPGSGIIYASTRKKCDTVAEMLAGEVRRPVVVYHAGMLPDQRHAAQDAFMSSRAEIVVATNAFGMGIDKADVRFVVHFNMPGSLEAYYQEAGRGRDGKPSRCLMLYNSQDRYVQEFFIESAYPARENVAKVYEHLCQIDADPIELTQQEIKEQLGLPIGAEGVGTCEQLLESADVLERLVSSQNLATVRLDSDLPTLVDLLPKQATVRRRVLRSIEKLVGQRRHEMVPFNTRELLRDTELDQASLAHALRELGSLKPFTYVPPFRGRAIRMLKRDVPFEQLEIDFQTLDRRKAAEYEKLQRVISFALSPRCRQQEILRYFGDEDEGNCDHCDNCRRSGGRPTEPAPTGPAHENLVRTVRIVLSGVARTQTRFPCGKNLIAQMLCGSNSTRMEKLGMNRLSTFGLLKEFTQQEAVALVNGLVVTGHLLQSEIDSHRPVVQLTPLGTEVMKGTKPLEGEVPLPPYLLIKICGGRQAADAGQRAAGGGEQAAGSSSDSQEPPAPDPAVARALRDWRSRLAVELALPVFMVLPNATIEELARMRPQSLESLGQVKGIGRAKLQQYGEDLLRILTGGSRLEGQPEYPVPDRPAGPPTPEEISSDYDAEPMEGPQVVGFDAPSPATPADPPSHYWTWRLLDAGFTADECAAIRGLKREVVLDQLLRALEEGRKVRIELCISPEMLGEFDKVVAKTHSVDIRLLLSRLPRETLHQEVQLYLKCR